MAHLLIAYSSGEGQTEKIAESMAGALREDGHAVRIENIDALQPLHLDEFDGVIVGASVHVGKHHRNAREFVEHYINDLNAMPSAFFSVSLSEAGQDEAEHHAAEQMIKDFLDQTGWEPFMNASIAGAVHFDEYGFIKRAIMRRILRQHGEEDVTHDHEYTDWGVVKDFAKHFSQHVNQSKTR